MKRRTAYLTLAVALILVLAGAGPTLRPARVAVADAGTGLAASATAAGFYEQVIEYDWAIEKAVTPASLTIAAGGSGSVAYTLTVTRTELPPVYRYGVRGTICVTNTGTVSTLNLAIADVVQKKMPGPGQYQDYASANVDVSARPVLGPGESFCYPYEVVFAPVAGALYRNAARVTIDNHSGHTGPFGPEPKSGFSLPAMYSTIYVDESSSVSDEESCPGGFACTPDDPGPWAFGGSGAQSFTTTVENLSALCDTYHALTDTATLVEGDTGQERTGTASVDIYTGSCDVGCTLSIGYWKNHAGLGPQPDEVTALLPQWLGTPGGTESVQVTTAAQAAGILGPDPASNGIVKLYAQLLGARLNIANGASATAVAGPIAAADAFLADHGAGGWDALSAEEQQTVLGWKTSLDDYNNGYIGPGHCEE